MRIGEDDVDQRTIFCGNLSDEVTDDILYELFLQAGPVDSVRRPKDQNGRPKSFAFIVYKHSCSVPYALELFNQEKLFNRRLNLNSHSSLHHIPVLDTHLSEFTEQCDNYRGNEFRDHRNYNYQRENEDRDHRKDRRHSGKERDHNEPKSWAELNALRGKGSLLNGHSVYQRSDVQDSSVHEKGFKTISGPSAMPDFNSLIQMGQQMMIPQMFDFQRLFSPEMGTISSPIMGGSIYPSMQQERFSGGEHRISPERDRRRKDHHQERGSRRDHPYDDRRQSDSYNDHRHRSHNDYRRHDRAFSSSRSSHERERKDRRSR